MLYCVPAGGKKSLAHPLQRPTRHSPQYILSRISLRSISRDTQATRVCSGQSTEYSPRVQSQRGGRPHKRYLRSRNKPMILIPLSEKQLIGASSGVQFLYAFVPYLCLTLSIAFNWTYSVASCYEVPWRFSRWRGRREELSVVGRVNKEVRYGTGRLRDHFAAFCVPCANRYRLIIHATVGKAFFLT